MKLQYKIALIIFGFGSIFLVGVESTSYFYNRSHHILELKAHSLERARERAEHIEITLIDKANVALALSNATAMDEALSGSN